MVFLRRCAAGLAVAAVFFAALWGAGQLSLPPAELSINELHLLWLTQDRPRFVPAVPDDGTLTTHFELQRLDNASARFARRKAPGTLRVFCIGGSTTQGYPYQHRFSYPALLGLMLKDLLPVRRVEVINAGIHGSDSTSDRALVAELQGYEPDLVLIYEGPNETWNAALHRGWRGAMVRLHLRLLRGSNLYAALREGTAWARPEWDHADAVRAWAAGGRPPPSGTVPALLRNLEWMLARLGPRRAALFTLAEAPDERYPLAGPLGPPIREAARRRGAPLIDVMAAFSASGEGMLPAPERHPSPAGYALLARSAAQALFREGLLAERSAWRWDRLRPDSAYLLAAGAEPAYLAKIHRGLAERYLRLGLPETARRFRELARGRREP